MLVKTITGNVKEIIGVPASLRNLDKVTVQVVLKDLSKPEILTNVVKLVVRDNHCLAVTSNNRLYGIGCNICGQLGLKAAKNVHGWCFIKDGIVDVHSTDKYTTVTTIDGFCLGSGDFSQDDPILGRLDEFITLL